jgi:HD-GYP domain-containing protein (c-di-GMP phosphodiesterase class II)
MKKHPSLGYDFTRDILSQASSVNSAVLYHHERYDGSGYPHGISGDSIPMFARIVAVADVFDAITSCRPYSQAKIASEAYEYIIGNKGSHFDPEVVETFHKTIAPFPVGLTVKLSNGLDALVVKNYDHFMSRPLVRAFEPNNPSDFEYIDLAFDNSALNITIVSTA